jgi:predicted trehalose synthase
VTDIRAGQAAASLTPLLGPYLGRQRWFAHDGGGAHDIEVERADLLLPGEPAGLWLLVRSGPARYQMLVGLRPAPNGIDLGERDLLGPVDLAGSPYQAYDGLADPALARRFAALIGVPDTDDEHVRPVGAEQSNTSVVLGEKVILKLIRRLQVGANPDVEVTMGLDRVGFNHLASPVAVWSRDGYDLAVAQEFLAGGAEGWALALTSLRDLLAGDSVPADAGGQRAAGDPATAGGDFASEARRLGAMTGRLHLALAEAFGTHPAAPDAWSTALADRATQLSLPGPAVAVVAEVCARLRALGPTGAGPAIRVHGDYHLGQVMRTGTGWFVLDFEGEPARPLAERRLPWSAAKDVAGMLRSFDYASQVALSERDASEAAAAAGWARAWEQRNRGAFLDGYTSVDGVGALAAGGDPAGPAASDVLAFFELDKALYEVGYERAHRPDWERIPLAAIERLGGG